MIAFFKRALGLNGAARAPVGRVSASEAQAMQQAGALIVDVRTPAERQAARIPGSKAMPLQDLPEQWQKLPGDRDIICQCASGSRSASAARFLAGQGLKVHNLSGGIAAWQQAGLPIKRG